MHGVRRFGHRPSGAGEEHPLLPSGEKCRVKRGDEGAEATPLVAKAPSSGAPRHLLPDGEKRTGQRLPSETKIGRESPPGHCLTAFKPLQSLDNAVTDHATPAGHPLLPSGEKCRVKRGDEGGEAIVFSAIAPSSGATRHLLPAGEKRTGQRLPSKARARSLRLPVAPRRIRQTTAIARPLGHRPCGAGGEHPLLPSGEKCRVKRGDEGAKPLYSLRKPPHPALRATFSPMGRRGPDTACPPKQKGREFPPGPNLHPQKTAAGSFLPAAGPLPPGAPRRQALFRTGV